MAVGSLEEMENAYTQSNEIASGENIKARLTKGLELISSSKPDRYYGHGAKTIQTVAFLWLRDFMAALYEVATAYDNSSTPRDASSASSPAPAAQLQDRFPIVVAWASCHAARSTSPNIIDTTMPFTTGQRMDTIAASPEIPPPFLALPSPIDPPSLSLSQTIESPTWSNSPSPSPTRINTKRRLMFSPEPTGAGADAVCPGAPLKKMRQIKRP